MNTTACYAGIDVSKSHLDIALDPVYRAWRVPNTTAGIQEATAALKEHQPERIVLEGTGGYEEAIADSLAKAGLPVCRANPRQVRDYAKSEGMLAKTDRLDARILAKYAKTHDKCVPYTTKSEGEREAQAVVDRRRQLVDMLTMERNRLGMAKPKVAAHIQKHIEWLEVEIKQIDGSIE